MITFLVPALISSYPYVCGSLTHLPQGKSAVEINGCKPAPLLEDFTVPESATGSRIAASMLAGKEVRVVFPPFSQASEEK
jgi:hypothetical protein